MKKWTVWALALLLLAACEQAPVARITGTVENAKRISPERTITPVEYFAIRCRRTSSAATPLGFTHMK